MNRRDRGQYLGGRNPGPAFPLLSRRGELLRSFYQRLAALRPNIILVKRHR